MSAHILMPALSPGMTVGKVARWLKSEGDAVSPGDVIAEIETDKATLDLEAGQSGVLGRLLVAAGDAAAVNAPIAVLLQAGGEPAPAGAAAAPPTAPERSARRVFASPVARRLARERDLDLAAVIGSGPGGRVVRADVEAVRPAAGTPAAPPRLPAAPQRPPAASDGASAAAGQATTAVPNSSARRVIARRLLESKQTIPHFDLTIDVEVDALLDLRRRVNAHLGNAGRLTVTDFVVKAVGLALREVPAVNATWTDEAILRFDAVHVAVAVATDTGLLTPVVRDADRKCVTAISGELRDLAARARAGKLRPEAYQGGGFTVTNLGMHGVREFAAIIDPPQSGILAVGAAEPRPVVRNGAVVVRTMMTCTLSADHRTVDGAVGAALLASFKGRIEDPLAFLLWPDGGARP